MKSPISVRENPDAPGRYLINHGARRFRGSKWAEKTTIPGFIDNDYNDDDQVIENLQRNELTAREIADYIGRELAKGRKKGEIAKAVGKSAAFITQHVTLLDLPEPIAEAFNSGRAKDVTVINELVTAYKKNPDEGAWLADDSQELTRGRCCASSWTTSVARRGRARPQHRRCLHWPDRRRGRRRKRW